ncbi:hypothetical protein KS2013_46 [Kangiella sediminilitoris]|uniref:Glyoxalase/bleomycin resistance protein/dioxygenase n=1 Tax=Kangiella sediminilitoris TaxID=1144748 RepID=A0A1B3B7M1_9GAMM|nr:hypothetical protein KS2013_46 [Kangiella sediminilitoris]
MRGIFHLSFSAKDFEDTRKFYEVTLGCTKGKEEEN